MKLPGFTCSSIVLALAPTAALAQGAVLQSGVVVTGNFASWESNGVIQDSGINSIVLNFPTIAVGHLIGNAGTADAAADDTALTALIDTLGSPEQGDVLYRDGASWTLLPPGSSGQFLETLGAGENPVWATPPGATYTGSASITLTGSAFSIAAPVTVPNGGTGLVSGTSGGIPGYTASGTLASSALLTHRGVMLGGGAGATPYALSSLGTTGQVLTSNGASADPSWVSAGAGTVTRVNTGHALSGGPITATGTIAAVDASSGVAGVVTPDANAAHFLSGAGTWLTPAGTTPAPLVGTSASLNPGTLAVGACGSNATVVTSATTAEAVVATPATYPGDGFDWKGYVSSAGTVTVKICNFNTAGAAPSASAFNIRVIP